MTASLHLVFLLAKLGVRTFPLDLFRRENKVRVSPPVFCKRCTRDKRLRHALLIPPPGSSFLFFVSSPETRGENNFSFLPNGKGDSRQRAREGLFLSLFRVPFRGEGVDAIEEGNRSLSWFLLTRQVRSLSNTPSRARRSSPSR